MSCLISVCYAFLFSVFVFFIDEFSLSLFVYYFFHPRFGSVDISVSPYHYLTNHLHYIYGRSVGITFHIFFLRQKKINTPDINKKKTI